MSINNGRFNDPLVGDNFQLYSLYHQKDERPNKWVGQEAIKSVHSKNEVSDLFFSRKNIEALQEGIRYMVFKKSCGKHTIDKQSETDLVVVMRSVYLQYGEFRPYGLLEQVKDLNARVLEYCVPKILEEIKLYMYYRKDISQLPVPLDRGQYVSSKGSKVLEQAF
jgi:Family of unknown function (DUF5761)